MPRFEFRTGILHPWTVEQTAKTVKHTGFDCLELCLELNDIRPEALDQDRHHHLGRERRPASAGCHGEVGFPSAERGIL